MQESWVQSLGWEDPLDEFPRETDLLLRCAGKAGNPFQTTQGNRLSCRDQEGKIGEKPALLHHKVAYRRRADLWGECWSKVDLGLNLSILWYQM